MHTTEILVVGATGYIGGTILSHLAQNSNYRLTAIVRRLQDAEAVRSCYSSLVRVVRAEDLSHDTLVQAASQADVVIYACRNTQDGIGSLMQGLSDKYRRNCSNESKGKGVFIMLSAIISLVNPQELALGQLSGRVFSDIDNSEDIKNLPITNWHVSQEQQFLQMGREHGVTAVVLSLPFALGNGTGPVRCTSFAHQYIKAIAEMGRPFVLGKGLNRWSWCSVQDIARAVGFLMSKNSIWEGTEQNQYYYLSSGDFAVKDEAITIGKMVGKGCDVEVLELDYDQFKEVMPELPALWGVSCQVKADRLRSAGWEAKDKNWASLLNDSWALIASHVRGTDEGVLDTGDRHVGERHLTPALAESSK